LILDFGFLIEDPRFNPKSAIKNQKSKIRGRVMAKKNEGRESWLDEESQKPLLDQYARQLDSFLQAMADGKVEDAEIKAQEARLVKLMKEVEPLLDDNQHEKVTELLCELTAYDLMQMLYQLQQARPRAVFRG
jgi:hypothetical protein